MRLRPDRASAKITRISPRVATISDRKCAGEARCLVEMLTAGRGEHQVGHHGPADAPGHLHREIRGGVPPAQPAERSIGERHHRVEMAAGHRPEHQDDREQPGRGRRRVLQQLQPHMPGERVWAAIPEPTTTAARNALPSNSASQPPPQRHVTHRRAPPTALTRAPVPQRDCHTGLISHPLLPSISVDPARSSLPGWIDGRQDRAMSMQVEPGRWSSFPPPSCGSSSKRAPRRWSVSRSARARRPGWRRCSRPSRTRSGSGWSP